MLWSAKQDNPERKPKRVIETLAGLPGKFGDRVLHVRADGSHINSKGRPITLPDTGNNRNRRVEPRAKQTGTSRGSFGAGLSGYGEDYTKPRHVYNMQRLNRVASEVRAKSAAGYQPGEARIVFDTKPAPVRSTFQGWKK